MNRLSTMAATVMTALVVGAAWAAPPAPGHQRSGYQRGEVYEIVRDKRMSQQGSNGSNGSSRDRDTLSVRVVGIQPGGVELEYDLPLNATPQDRARAWQFPARVFKAPNGPMRLL